MPMNFSLPVLMKMINQSGNPQNFVLNMVKESAGGNPLFSNLISLAQQGRGNEIESIARNIFKEQGRDFDKEFNSFRRTIKL